MRAFYCALIVALLVLVSGCTEESPVEDKADAEAFIVTPVASPPKPAETPIPPEPQVNCDRFDIVAETTSPTLNLSVDTDLPDSAVVMVAVSRSYLEQASSATQSLDYFSEKGTVGEWKSEHTISIDCEEWSTALRAKRREADQVGAGFDVASISDHIKVSMVVPINQPDPRFGDGTRNLGGSVVTPGGIRVVEDKCEILSPLPEMILPTYEVVDCDHYDAPIKTQIEQHAIVSGTITEAGLNHLLHDMFDEADAYRGFKYYDGKPTHVFIYLYPTKDHFKSSEGQWIAMLSKVGEGSSVEIDVRPEMIAQLTTKPEVKNGLPESKRREIL